MEKGKVWDESCVEEQVLKAAGVAIVTAEMFLLDERYGLDERAHFARALLDTLMEH